MRQRAHRFNVLKSTLTPLRRSVSSMIKLSRSFVLGDAVEWPGAIDRICALFDAHSFELIEGSRHDNLVFVRGSWLSTVMAFNPEQWKVVAKIRPDWIDGIRCLILELEVSTSGQVVSTAEREYFVMLLKELYQSLHSVIHSVDAHSAMILYGGDAAQRELVRGSHAARQNLATMGAFFFVFPVVLVALNTLLGMTWLFAAGGAFMISMLVWNAYLFSTKK